MKRLFTLLILMASPCAATDNLLEFSYGRGVPQNSLQLGSQFQAEGDRGPEWFADWMRPVGRLFYVGIGGGHFHSQGDVSTAFVPNAATTLASRATTILLLGKVNLTPSSTKGMLYAIAGAGWQRNTLTISATPISPWSDTGTNEGRTFMDFGQNALAHTEGIGLEYPLGGKFYFGGEFRYQTSTRRDFSLTQAGLVASGQNQTRASLSLMLLSLKIGVQY